MNLRDDPDAFANAGRKYTGGPDDPPPPGAAGQCSGTHSRGQDDAPASWPGRFKLELAETIEDLDEPEFLLTGAMPATGVGVLYGDTGSLKTFLALDLSLAIPRGQAWAGRKTKKGAVVYITGEASAGIRKRI
jgi:hypothetical protein